MAPSARPDSSAGRPIKLDATSSIPPGRWAVEADRSSVAFTIRHLMVATVQGAFNRFDATLESDSDGLRRAEGVVEVASISTGERKRDEVLMGEGFFDADQHPDIAFVSREVEQDEHGRLQITGELTIKGITRPVRLLGTLAAMTNGSGEPSRAKIVVRGAISRTQFGVTGGGVIEAAGALVSDSVNIALEMSAVRVGQDGQ